MANKQKPTDSTHFNKLYWFILGLTGFGMILTLATIFIPIDKENQRFADTGIIFWLSTAVSGGIGYLIGNSASAPKKKEDGTPEDCVDCLPIEKEE